jgi:two-component system alkaline phosphatase synthesis response regulator PhoP
MSPTILLVEDEVELVRVLRDYLERAGFRVQTASTGPEAVSRFQHAPDLVLATQPAGTRRVGCRPDYAAPRMCRSSRSRHVDETDRLVGLGSVPTITSSSRSARRAGGACPGRVAALRRGAACAGNHLQAGDVVVDLTRHQVDVADRRVALTPSEFELLVALVREPGRVFTRLQLLEASQGTSYTGYERTVDAHIKNLRAKIEPDPRRPRYVQTVFGVGYRFSDE